MARQLGTYTLSSNIEMNAGAPLDARDIVPAKSDLTTSGQFPYPYIGMETYVVAEDKKYRLIGSDPTDISNWEEVGSGSGAGAIKGYYNTTDGKFYEESTYTTEITPDATLLYLDLSTENLYDYDGSAYTRIDPIDSQVPTITEASSRANIAQGDSIATVLGKVKKYFADLGDLAYVSSVTSGMVTTALGYTPYDSASAGTAAAKNFTTSVTQNSTDLVTSGAVWNAIDNLPEPMVFKGTLGTGGTITTLPAAAAANEGFTYKVITAGTYASIVAKVGDVFTSNGSEWVLIPSGDTDSDTWRAIYTDGTEVLGSAISTGRVNFISGTNVTVDADSGGNITINADDEKVTITNTNPTSGTVYYPVWHTNTSGTSVGLKANNGLFYKTLQGTASAAGYSIIIAGNSTSTGTAGNKFGALRVYSEKNGTATIKATAASTSDRVFTLPDKDGTVALTSDLSSYLPLSGGTMTGALNFKNGTANKVGDDVQIGDYNKGGSLGVQGLNGNTSIKLIKNGASWASASEGGMILYNSTSKSLDFVFE